MQTPRGHSAWTQQRGNLLGTLLLVLLLLSLAAPLTTRRQVDLKIAGRRFTAGTQILDQLLYFLNFFFFFTVYYRM